MVYQISQDMLVCVVVGVWRYYKLEISFIKSVNFLTFVEHMPYNADEKQQMQTTPITTPILWFPQE